jgi:hypothetical protein
VVTVQVGDENMVDPAAPDLVLIHLCLCAFPAINEEKMVIEGNHLRCGVPVESWYGRIISKYGYREHRQDLGMINRVGNLSFLISDEK